MLSITGYDNDGNNDMAHVILSFFFFFFWWSLPALSLRIATWQAVSRGEGGCVLIGFCIGVGGHGLHSEGKRTGGA